MAQAVPVILSSGGQATPVTSVAGGVATLMDVVSGGNATLVQTVASGGMPVIFTTDPDAQSWADQVAINGGSVSAARLTLVSNFIKAEKAAGTWALTDEYWLFWGENSQSALTSLKQRRLATVTNAPTFVVDRGYTFDGTTNFISTGFLPGTHAVALKGNDRRMAVYERTNVATTTYSMGETPASSPQTMRLSTRTSGNTYSYDLGCSSGTGGTVTDSRGWTACYRTPADELGIYKNGVFNNTRAIGTTTLTIQNISMYIGANNNLGPANAFRATSIGAAAIGASLTAGQEAAQYSNIQTLATAIGANV